MSTIVIRKVGASLRLSIPAEVVRELQLQSGDVAVWKQEGVSCFRVRFAKVTEREEEEVPELEAQTAA